MAKYDLLRLRRIGIGGLFGMYEHCIDLKWRCCG